MNLPFIKPRRRVPTPEPEPRHTSLAAAPLDQPSVWRARIVTFSILTIIMTAVTIVLNGPMTRITSVQVTGNVFVTTDSVTELASYLLEQRWLGIFPQRQVAFFREGAFAQAIERRIGERIAVKNVNADITGKTVTVTINERLPVAIWAPAGSASGWLDGSGRIVSIGPPPPNLVLPTVNDLTARSIRVGEDVVDAGVVTAITTLNDALRSEQYVDFIFEMPVPTCIPNIPEEEEVVSNTNTSSNSNRNTNRTNANANSNRNANTNTRIEPEVTCDLAQLLKQRPEVDVRLKEGPLVRFDRYTNLSQAVSALTRLMAEEKTAQAKSIDLRFPERAYIQ